ncbi:MAG: NAD-dependent epimerase/dehydratase family protein, partial [Bacteroidales bacterium]|nr:NAD-dependent epimerase/dehydratase family protein [Bacteroidales bacterium]
SVTINLWGSGKPMREFLWVEDMAEACVFVMENVSFQQLTKEKEEIRNTHLNIGTGKDISIKELAEQIAQTIGFRGKLQFDTTKPDGTLRKLTNPSRLNQLGWKHKVEIKEGIQRIYNWYINA